jgi:hypothetical protein
MNPIRTYEVRVDGFPPGLYSARSPAKARVRAWREYTAAYDATFKRFMQISRVRLAADPPGIGRRVLVSGRPATVVIGHGHYVNFMRDDDDVVLCSHPADVTEIAATVAPTLPVTE